MYTLLQLVGLVLIVIALAGVGAVTLGVSGLVYGLLGGVGLAAVYIGLAGEA